MSQTVNSSPTLATSQPEPVVPSGFDLAALEESIATSPVLAKVIVFGLPLLGMLATLPGRASVRFAGRRQFPVRHALCVHKALATFTGRLSGRLVAARLVFILALGGLLLGTTGTCWISVIRATSLAGHRPSAGPACPA